jgi:hypothetical protein
MRGAFACAIEAAIVGRALTSAGEDPADLLEFPGADFIPDEEQSGVGKLGFLVANSRMGEWSSPESRGFETTATMTSI